MRVTNAGIIGNAFFDRGLSSDPSFEFPRGSGNEGLNHAELWVGALDETGHGRVSGGPMLEWRPTLDPKDHVLTGWNGQPGTRRLFDDDGDGKIDEEIFNGKDDDGDGEIDEDLSFSAQEVMAADYVDDRPEAINYGYPNGEVHHPFHLSVHQEAYAWSVPGFDAIAGLQFTITNHGAETLHMVHVGLLADLDSRGPNDPTGHLNDQVVYRSYARDIPEGTTSFNFGFILSKACITHLAGTVPVVVDGPRAPGLPAMAVMPLGHTTDPLGLLTNDAFTTAHNARAAARAPARDSFIVQVFANDLPPGQGGVPVLDGDRYAAMLGQLPVAPLERPHDYVVLVSAGPFYTLAPGQSVDFAVAIVAATDPDSLPQVMSNAAYLYHGNTVNLLPDSASITLPVRYNSGATGIGGHEVCIEPPSGVTFTYEPNCPAKFYTDFGPLPGDIGLAATEAVYSHGHCIWTDADCDACTGFNGNETVAHWLDPGTVPAAPDRRVTADDHQVRIEWNNLPEILLKAGLNGAPGYHFIGYHVYKLSDWQNRTSLVPPPSQWVQIGAFAADTSNGERPLSAITDTTLDYELLRYGLKQYPIGRYAISDSQVLNGFDYLYSVTAVSEKRTVLAGGGVLVQRLESPLIGSLDSLVTPKIAARGNASQVWVVPNPFRAHAAWDRAPVLGDPFGRHIDFFGLPRARCLIKIWTLAGDLVARIDHDGSRGDGQASWNLISRNGQDVESGVYLFTVDSPLGKSLGRFVVIR